MTVPAIDTVIRHKGRYRTVHCAIWFDDWFPRLNDDAKLVVFHLLTTPFSTPFGLYRASVEALAVELGWHPDKYRDAISDAFSGGFGSYDEVVHVVWIKRHLLYNFPNGPNQAKAWGNAFAELPACGLKTSFIQTVKAILDDTRNNISNAMKSAIANAFIYGTPYPGTGTGTGEGTVDTPPVDTPPRGTQRRTKRAKTMLPDDFNVPPRWLEWAKEKFPDIDADAEVAIFVTHDWPSPGHSDWYRTWQNWMARAERSRRGNGDQSPTGGRKGETTRQRVERLRSQ